MRRAIITDADCRSSDRHHQRSPFFKVLANIVADDYRNDYREYNNLYIYSSAKHGWSDPTNWFHRWFNEDNPVSLQWRKRVVVCGAMAHWLVASVSRFYILGVSIETDDICLKGRVITPDGNAFYKRVYRRPNTLCHRRWLALVVLAGSGRSCPRRYLDGDSRRWSHRGEADTTKELESLVSARVVG
jgi:hypothetical protein